jgi:hypothetical protein
MPVLPKTAYSRAEDALTLARALVNDTSAAVFTDTLLMPLLNSAYRGLQRELAENGVSVLMEQQDVELDLVGTTGVTNTEISDVSSPQLPTDCLMPHVLWDRATASNGDVFVPMEKFTSGGSMLNLQPSTYMRLWEWREDKINLIGATQSITVRVRYEKVLATLVVGTNPVQIRSATDALGYATAALAARSRGARACRGSAGRGTNGHREFDQSVRASGADDGTAAKTLWISARGRIPVASPGLSPGCSARRASKAQISAALIVVHD